MAHRRLTVAATGSLLFTIFVAFLWVRSFSARGDAISFSISAQTRAHLVSYRGGITYYSEASWPRYQLQDLIAVRHALLVIVGLILPAWRWGRGRLRLRTGFCRNCGYDLRATPDRCPECGVEPGEPMILEAPSLGSRMALVGALAAFCLLVSRTVRQPDIADDTTFFALVSGIVFVAMALIAGIRALRNRSKSDPRITRSTTKEMQRHA